MFASRLGASAWRAPIAVAAVALALFAIGLFAVALPAGAARAAAAAATAPPAPEPQVVVVGNRNVVTLHATLLGSAPRERATLATTQLDAIIARGGARQVTRTATGDGVRFEVDGSVVFFLMPDDVAGMGGGMTLDVAAQEVQRRLEVALAEAREMTDPTSLLKGASLSAVVTVVAALLVWGVVRVRRRVAGRVRGALDAWRARHAGTAMIATWSEHVSPALLLLVDAVAWVFGIAIADAWVTFVLRQFAYTRPWGERATAWMLDQIGAWALAVARAIPGLVTALLIFLVARLISRAVSRVLLSVERGDLQVGWLDADIAAPTRRLGTVVVWLFAIAMAYPYLPGSGTEAFKGITVLAGLMLSLGASGVIGQALSGLSLMYSRALRVGEYVKVGDIEGTVVSVGMLATRIHTGMGEEVSLPSALVFGQPVRNFSRLVPDGRFVLHTAVTIGYSTPWRQVHALLLEAARRTPGVADTPPPYVVQTALSDFYVEYRLCAQATRNAPHRRIEAINALHGHVLDVFNEYGVQIMSPHYETDPAEPQLVPPGAEFAAPAARVVPPSAPDGAATR
ncbi:MAG: mechanosensitive ion channel family protein [Burkholderiales bacterium]|nr:mechanosensitive ion channel family protein [Burkholderiales bacterium]